MHARVSCCCDVCHPSARCEGRCQPGPRAEQAGWEHMRPWILASASIIHLYEGASPARRGGTVQTVARKQSREPRTGAVAVAHPGALCVRASSNSLKGWRAFRRRFTEIPRLYFSSPTILYQRQAVPGTMVEL